MRFTVLVKPGSKKGPLVEANSEQLTVFLRERAVDGAANEGLLKVLASHFGVRTSDVTIESGHASRIKRVRIEK